MNTPNKRTGRRAGSRATRDQILSAARLAFAEHGFAAATIRSIAADAGVDGALVLHYFGSKAALFAEATSMPVEIIEVIGGLLDVPIDDLGEAVVRTIVNLGDNPHALAAWTAMIRSGMADADAAAALQRFLGGVVLGPIAARLGGGDALLRMSLVASQVVGLGIARHVLALPPLATQPSDDVVAAVAPTIQRYLTGPLT